ALDGRTQGPIAIGTTWRGRSFRLPRRARQTGTGLDAGPRVRVAVPPCRRTQAIVAALPIQQPPLHRVRGHAAAREEPTITQDDWSREQPMKVALITGITGQDGSYLTEMLLARNYVVHGVIRRASTFNTDRIDHLYADPHEIGTRLFLHYGDLSDGPGLRRVLEVVQPDEIYNLGAQSHVGVSFMQPEYTADADALGTLRLLEAIRDYRDRTRKDLRFYQAGTSEMFGGSAPPQSEVTPFYPKSP